MVALIAPVRLQVIENQLKILKMMSQSWRRKKGDEVSEILHGDWLVVSRKKWTNETPVNNGSKNKRNVDIGRTNVFEILREDMVRQSDINHALYFVAPSGDVKRSSVRGVPQKETEERCKWANCFKHKERY